MVFNYEDASNLHTDFQGQKTEHFSSFPGPFQQDFLISNKKNDNKVIDEQTTRKFFYNIKQKPQNKQPEVNKPTKKIDYKTIDCDSEKTICGELSSITASVQNQTEINGITISSLNKTKDFSKKVRETEEKEAKEASNGRETGTTDLSELNILEIQKMEK